MWRQLHTHWNRSDQEIHTWWVISWVSKHVFLESFVSLRTCYSLRESCLTICRVMSWHKVINQIFGQNLLDEWWIQLLWACDGLATCPGWSMGQAPAPTPRTKHRLTEDKWMSDGTAVRAIKSHNELFLIESVKSFTHFYINLLMVHGKMIAWKIKIVKRRKYIKSKL